MNTVRKYVIFFLLAILVSGFQVVRADTQIKDSDLVKPNSMTIDSSLDKTTADQMIRAAKLFYTFWNTGDNTFLDAVISPHFIDNTLPEGRPQGPKGIKVASENFRKAVPDLHCSLEDLLIVGDKVTARLLFTGTFKGTFKGIPGTNKPIKFFAIDILRIKDGRLVEDWHLEDNLTLLLQLNAVKMVK